MESTRETTPPDKSRPGHPVFIRPSGDCADGAITDERIVGFAEPEPPDHVDRFDVHHQ
jgi:hypothetical protein